VFTAKRLYNSGTWRHAFVYNRFAVKSVDGSVRFPGCAARPWALEYNRFAVKTGAVNPLQQSLPTWKKTSPPPPLHRGERRTFIRPFALQFPSLAIFAAEEFIRTGHVGDRHILAVEQDLPPCTESDASQIDSVRNGAGVQETSRRLRSLLDGLKPRTRAA